jgi:hypothetical protein
MIINLALSHTIAPCSMVCLSCWRQCWCFLLFLFRCFGASLEATAVFAGLQNVAAMGEAIEQGRSHFGVTEYACPFAEAEVGGVDDAGACVELAQEVDEQSPAGGAERQVS